MKTRMRWLAAAILALTGLAASRAEAASSTATLNIDVTITAVKSVAIVTGGVYADTVAFNWNGVASTLTATSSVTVINDSVIVTEGWELSTAANSWLSGAGSGSWTIAASSVNLAAENVAIQAVFGSSNTLQAGCAATTSSGTWTVGTIAPPLTTVATQYGPANKYASPELNWGGGLATPDNGNNMYGNGNPLYGSRALCWRMVMPPSTTATGTQVVPIIVTAL